MLNTISKKWKRWAQPPGSGLIVAAAVSGFWISGYSVEVVRAVLDKDDVMPGINFSRNLKDGFFLFLSSIAYWILFMVLLAAELFVIQATQSLGAVSALLAIAGLVVTVIALAVMGWAYFVGMARFAAEGNHRAVFDIRRNIGIAGKHRAAGATLLMYMVGLSIIYGGVRSLVDGIFGGAAGMLGITLSIVLYYIFNLMQHFSTQHLIAQYAVQIGIGAIKILLLTKTRWITPDRACGASDAMGGVGGISAESAADWPTCGLRARPESA